MRFPTFAGTMSQSEALTPVPPHFVPFVWQYLSSRSTHLWFRSRCKPARLRRTRGISVRFPITVTVKDGDIRDSQVPGEPFVHAVFYDPGGPSDPSLYRRTM